MSEIIIRKIPPEIYQYIFTFLNPISKATVSSSLININWCSQCGEYLQSVYYLNYQEQDYICRECYLFNDHQDTTTTVS